MNQTNSKKFKFYKNPGGIFIIIFSFTIINSALSQSVPFRQKNLWGLSDLKGNLISPAKYDSIEFTYSRTKNTVSKVWKAKKTGLIDVKGKEILSPVYESVSDNTDFIIVGKNNKYGIFNYKGLNILPMIYDKIETEQQGYIYLTQKSKKGLARYASIR